MPAAAGALTAAVPSDHAAVCAITGLTGTLLGATGTLVAPRAVLTTASAIEGIPATSLRVVFSSALGSPTDRLYGVARVYVDPAYFGGDTREHDLALLRLTNAVADVTPIPTPTGPVGLRGEAVVVVGFGATSTGGTDSGIRRQGSATLSIVTPSTWTIAGMDASVPCLGDSGAPVLLDEAGVLVVGAIMSEGDCGTYGLGPTLAASTPFLDETLALIETVADAGTRPDAGPRSDAGRPVDAGRDAGSSYSPPRHCACGAHARAAAPPWLVALALGGWATRVRTQRSAARRARLPALRRAARAITRR